ncbi:hypothetical protein Aeh1ORF141c [Aeromonas phage Aeh1]|uniref:Uncharacterized protein n=1 Tax=Aeromonas phage Aeh1 TaxID=2880362 RepID=Q76YU0_9CAUD|nr:hypothetical protein Aeh1p151 [Aeromonas phage Aeh1]AAQ17806.1 hypothetical protein Aeh1ORF141c [Aeromonas phage Aeh1]
MIVFGWIVLVIIAVVVSFATAFGTYAQLALSGKIDIGTLIPVAASGALWYAVCVNCPFMLVMN